MSHDMPLQDLWQQITERQDFSQFERYDSQLVVEKLTEQERDAFALLLVLYGQKIITTDYQRGASYLERGMTLAPNYIELHILAGKAYVQLNRSLPALEAAVMAYARAATLDPDNSLFYYHWGTAVMYLGRVKGDISLLLDADHLLHQAEELSRDCDDTFFTAMYWIRGQLWHSLSHLSGEPCDLEKALQYYRRVADRDIQVAPFWNDYADALCEIGNLLKNPPAFEEIVALYHRAIDINPRYYPAQFHLGNCYQAYFEETWKSSLFWHAHEQYTHCRVLNPQEGSLYHAWGCLFLLQGQLRRDNELLDQGCELLEQAAALGSNDLEELDFALVKTYLWRGSIYDDLALLRQAKDRAEAILAAHPTSAEAALLVGQCYTEYGHYFSEESYYHLALEKLAYALSLSETSSKIWYSCATTNLALGELTGDPEYLKMALGQFERATEFDGPFFPQFWNEWGVTSMKLAEHFHDRSYLELAVEKFETAIDSDFCLSDGEHVDPEWLYNYGCAYDFLGDMLEDSMYYERSILLLQKVLEIDPNYLQARYNLAVAYTHLGECMADIEALKAACEHFRLLLLHDVEDEIAWNDWGMALMNLALLLYEDADPDQAEAHFQEAEGKLQHATALGYNIAFYNLACLYSVQGDNQAAIAHLERAAHNAGLPSLEDVMQDPWLDGVRQTEPFRRLLSHLLSKYGGEHNF